MLSPIRRALRWTISSLLVTLPVAYLFWNWRYEEHPVLEAISYEALNERFTEGDPAPFWTYVLYFLLAILVINTATAVVAGILGRIFPDDVVRVPGED
jgi:hypothetical protein